MRLDEVVLRIGNRELGIGFWGFQMKIYVSSIISRAQRDMEYEKALEYLASMLAVNTIKAAIPSPT